MGLVSEDLSDELRLVFRKSPDVGAAVATKIVYRSVFAEKREEVAVPFASGAGS
jgi:hypothetical protein